MLRGSVRQRVKGADRAADAMHAEVDEDPDSLRPASHDFGDTEFGKRGAAHAAGLPF